MAEILIFLKRVSMVSFSRATTSERLQNCFDCKIISPHGFVPIGPTIFSPLESKYPSHFFRTSSRREGKVLARDPLLKIPRSPDPDFIRASHSSKNSALDGFCVYTAELFASILC